MPFPRPYRLWLLLSLLLPGCAAVEDDMVTVEFWAMGREGEVVQALLPEFERTHPGIRVRVQQLPWSAAHEKLLTAFAGDALPDLCQLGSTWVPEFIALGALEDLSPWLADTPEVDPDDFFPGNWDANTQDGHVYGLPWYVDTRLLFYRRDLLARAGYAAPPTTWAEWQGALQRVKEVAGAGNYAILLPINEYDQPIIFGLQQQESMLRENGTYGNFRSEAFRRSFTFYIDMFRNGWAPALRNTQISNVWQEFANGYFSFYITGPWNIGEFRRRLPAELQDAWMTAPMPGPESGTPGASLAGGSSLVLFRQAARKPEALAFIAYLARPDVQARFHALTGNLPARKSAWEDSLLVHNPYAHAFREQLQYVKPPPKVPEWERIADQIRIQAEAVVNGTRTIDEALERLDRSVDQILEKRRWMLAQQEQAP